MYLAALSLEGRRHSPAPLSAPRPPRVWHSILAHTLCKSLCKRVWHILCATQHFCTLPVHTQCVLLCSVCKAFAFACRPAYYLSFMSAECTQCCQPSAFWLIKLGAGGVPWGSSLCPLGLQVPTCHPGIPSNDARVSSRIQLIHVEQHDPTPPGATKEARSSHRCRV